MMIDDEYGSGLEHLIIHQTRWLSLRYAIKLIFDFGLGYDLIVKTIIYEIIRPSPIPFTSGEDSTPVAST